MYKNIRYFFVADVAKHKHITLQYCPTDEMIGYFFTKPLGSAKFRRFRNIIMNCSFDDHGPVDVDALMKVHEEKMNKRISAAITKVGSDGGSAIGENIGNVDPQECVGKVSYKMWANIRITHKSHKRDVTLPPISDSHEKIWSDNKKTRVVQS